MDGIQITLERAGARQDIAVVKIVGYIDTTTSGELEHVIQNLLREQHFKIVIDLQNVDYISSAGWGIFISEIKNIRTHHGDLKLACMSESVNEVYELLEFSSILMSVSSVAEALRMFEAQEGAGAAGAAAKPTVRPPAVAPAAQTARTAAMPPAAAQPVAPPPPAAAPAHPPEPVIPKPVPASQMPSEVKPAGASKPGSLLLERIKVVVRENPRWGAWKIKSVLNRRRGALPKVSWGEVRRELKLNRLDGKLERIKFTEQGS